MGKKRGHKARCVMVEEWPQTWGSTNMGCSETHGDLHFAS